MSLTNCFTVKESDSAYTKKFEAKQQLEQYISRTEDLLSDPTTSIKIKRNAREKIESALSDAMAALEVSENTAEEYKRKEVCQSMSDKILKILLTFYSSSPSSVSSPRPCLLVKYSSAAVLLAC